LHRDLLSLRYRCWVAEEKSVLGAIWGIMKTFLKFGDDEDQKTSAVDALQMWVSNQTHGYKGVEIKDFTKSWHNGRLRG
jgi:hypothetical protein